jgi:hypothetical protein
MQVWLSTGAVVTTKEGRVDVVPPPFEGEDPVHAARSTAVMQMIENAILSLSM